MSKPKGTLYSIESIFIAKSKPGSIGFTQKSDRQLTSLATFYKRKIKTERVIVISGTKEKPVAKGITKITII